MRSSHTWGTAALGGVVLGGSVVFGPVPAFGFFAGALLIHALVDATTFRRALLVGWLAGAICNAIALYWIVGLLQAFAHFPLVAAIPVATLLFIAQGLVLGIATAIAWSAARCGAALWLALPAAIVATFTLAPFLFPWRLASSSIGILTWAQVAELGGTPLLDALMVLTGTAAYEAMRRRRKLVAALAAGLVVVPIVFGLVRLGSVTRSRDAAPTIRVGVVQPNIGIFDKHDPRFHPMHLQLLQDMSVALERRGAELIVWPESAYPFPFPRGVQRDLRGRLAIRRADMHTSLLVGAITRASRCDRWNSAIALDRDGRITGVSDKVELLAFGETVPLWDVLPPLQSMFPCPGIRAAAHPEVVALDGTRLGVLNCYEDVLAEHGRTLALREPELLVNVTNDAWFGQTREPHLHQLVARYRAIETRRDLVRVVNTGVSAHIASTGATLYETETWVQTSFVADAKRLSGDTLWVRIGDTTTPAAYAFLLAWLLVGLRRRKRDERDERDKRDKRDDGLA